MAINSLGMNVKQAISDFDDIKQAIEDKGVAISDGTPTSDYKYKVNEIPYYPWVRPKDRPAVPVISPGEQVFYALFGVSENGANDYAIQFRTTHASGFYVINWGDGVIEEIASNTKAEHIYNFSTLGKPVGSEGYKWVYIKCYPKTGDFFEITTDIMHSTRTTAKYVPQIFEIYMQCEKLALWSWSINYRTHFQLLDRFHWYGINNMATFHYFLYNSYNLQDLIINTDKCYTMTFFLGYCRNFNQPITFKTTECADFRALLIGCSKFNQKIDFDFSKAIAMNLFMSGCTSFNQPINFNTPAVMGNSGEVLARCSALNQEINIPYISRFNGTNLFYQNYAQNKPIYMDTSMMTSFANAFNGMESYSHGLTVDLLSATAPINSSFIGTTNYAMTGLRLLNMSNIHNMLTISNSNLNAQKLELLFGDLCNRTGLTTGVITITGCYGTSSLTNVQKAICVSKNWTIAL